MPGRKISVTQARSFVLYGRSSTGKTTLAATFPAPILYLDIRDRGTDSISDVMKKGDVIGRQIDSFREFETMYWWIKKHPNDFETIVVDTCTQLQQLLLREIAVEKGKDPETIGDWGSMTKRDWGEVSGVMKEWLLNYRNLVDDGINIVFIAQDRVFNSDEDDPVDGNEDSITPEVAPALMKSVAQVLNASVSFIGHTFIHAKEIAKEGKKPAKIKYEYGLRIGPSQFYVTKVRKPRGIDPPSRIYDPSYDDILAIIKGE